MWHLLSFSTKYECFRIMIRSDIYKAVPGIGAGGRYLDVEVLDGEWSDGCHRSCAGGCVM